MRVKDDDELIDVPLTSFMDCAFLLLIFFLVTAIMKKPHKQIPIELPEATQAVVTKTLDKTMVITLERGGRIHVGPEVMTQATLPQVLRKAAQSDPTQPVRIEADKDATVERLAYILDLCQFEGLKNVGVKTKYRD